MQDSNDNRFYYVSKAFWDIININVIDFKYTFHEIFTMRAIKAILHFYIAM